MPAEALAVRGIRPQQNNSRILLCSCVPYASQRLRPRPAPLAMAFWLDLTFYSRLARRAHVDGATNGTTRRQLADGLIRPAVERTSQIGRCAPKGILSIVHHRRTADSTAPSDRWVRNSGGARGTRRAIDRLVNSLGEFNWVGRLPCAAGLRVSLCLKGLSCASLNESAAKEMAPARLHSCVEEPGGRANGTEAVCAFRFILDHYYDRQWQGVYFAHDDVAVNPAHNHNMLQLQSFLRHNEWPVWPSDPRDMTSRHCGCLVVREKNFDMSYYWYRTMQWWIDSFHGPHGKELVANKSIVWPIGFMFAVDATTIRQHSLSYYQALYRLARLGIELSHEIRFDTGSLGDAFELMYHPDSFGHAFERLPFLVFAPRSPEAPDPRRLCKPRCEGELTSLLKPSHVGTIIRKLHNANALKRFPSRLSLPSSTESLVTVRPATLRRTELDWAQPSRKTQNATDVHLRRAANGTRRAHRPTPTVLAMIRQRQQMLARGWLGSRSFRGAWPFSGSTAGRPKAEK